MESGMGLETAQRTGNQSFLDSFGSARPKVLVIGCGGAGGNSVHRLHRMGIHGARTVVVNTDAVHLDSIQADRKLLIGGGVTRGMGAGGRPEIGERCAEISEQELRNQIGDADLTFITVGLGGGTGTGVAPHVAELAQAAGSVVISLATTPFRAERGRMMNARAGIQRLRDRTDSLILLDNNRLLDLVPNLPVEQAFAVRIAPQGASSEATEEPSSVPTDPTQSQPLFAPTNAVKPVRPRGRPRKTKKPIDEAPVVASATKVDNSNVPNMRAARNPSKSPRDLNATSVIKIDKSMLYFSEIRRHRHKTHLRFVALQPCLICGRAPSDAHHLRFAQRRALGRKNSDEFVVPLCRMHHSQNHQVGDEFEWWKSSGIDPLQVASRLWSIKIGRAHV